MVACNKDIIKMTNDHSLILHQDIHSFRVPRCHRYWVGPDNGVVPV